MSQAHEVKQSLDEVKTLLAHLETASWVEEDWGLLQRVLRSYDLKDARDLCRSLDLVKK